MVLVFKDYLKYKWVLDKQLISRQGPAARIDKHPVPRGRDWRLLPYFSNDSLPKDILCFCSFSLDTHPNRSLVYESMKEQKFLTFGKIFKEWELHREMADNKSFLRFLKRSKFCISPPGKGADCFRTWDALYEKSIPIVQPKNCPVLSRYRDLPILYVDDYSEVTEDLLIKEYKRMLDTEYDFSKLFLHYWTPRVPRDKLTQYLRL